MGFSDWWRARWRRHKRTARRAAATLRAWWEMEGIDEARKLFSRGFGILWQRYGSEAKRIVRGLRDQEIPVLHGESYAEAFLRVLVDHNRDGKISLEDVPERWLIRLREVALGIVEDEDEELTEALSELFDALEGRA